MSVLTEEAARTLATARWEHAPTYRLVCAHCGREFSAKQKSAIYCGHSCRQMAYAKRKRIRPTKVVNNPNF